MPFTFSHPAVSVPFKRWGFVLSALIVGSMSPDFMYFVKLSSKANFSHTLYGVFLFCMPTGLAVLWVFHALLKRPMLSLLPISHQERLFPVVNGFTFRPLRRFILIVESLLLGAFTHIVWDLFTHPYGYVLTMLPFLNFSIIEGAFGIIKVYQILYIGSTAIGIALLSFWYVRWFKQAPNQQVNSREQLSTATKCSIILVIVLSVGVLDYFYGAIGIFTITDFYALSNVVVRASVVGTSVACIELVVFSILWHLTMPRKRTAIRS